MDSEKPALATTKAVSIAFPRTDQLPSPEFANFFGLSWSGGVEVQMDLGFLDLAGMSGARHIVTNDGSVPVVFSHRILMSARGFAQLRQQVLLAAEHLMAEGVPLDEFVLQKR